MGEAIRRSLLLLVLLPLSPRPRGSSTPPTCDRKLSAIARRYSMEIYIQL
jgi:hypothetical protein